MQVRAVSKEIGVSSSKVRLLVDMVRGKKVEEALSVLQFTPTPNARAVAKAIKSAAANAENNYQIAAADLKIIDIRADESRTLKRYRARARGRASSILKRASNITVIVAEEEK